jgi:hypothetical protein
MYFDVFGDCDTQKITVSGINCHDESVALAWIEANKPLNQYRK